MIPAEMLMVLPGIPLPQGCWAVLMGRGKLRHSEEKMDGRA